MRPSHGDYRPAERRRYVPSGSPRRKLPVIRVALLLGLALFVYASFDDYWPRVASLWQDAAKDDVAARSTQSAKAAEGTLRWSADSSLFALDCPRGIAGACCEALDRAAPGVCGEARSLVARARWKGLLGKGGASGHLRLEAGAASDESGERATQRFALSGLAGRDDLGGFVLRRRGAARAWCDAARGCLGGGRPAPVLPLANARLEAQDSSGAATWTSGSRWVRAALAGRVSGVDSAGGGVIVRLYHGFELYTAYGPLTAAPGVRPGAAVKAGSHLGDAPLRGMFRTLAVRVRHAGRDVDPAAFWNARPSGVSALASAAATDPETEATP